MRFPRLILFSACGFLPLLGAENVSGQDIKSLLKDATQSVAPQPEPDAATQLDWAKSRLADATAAEKALDPAKLTADLSAAGIPLTRLDDLKTDIASAARNYAAAVDSLTAVLNNRAALEEARKAPPLPPPTDEKGVDQMRVEGEDVRRDLGAIEIQTGLDEAFLERQRALLEEASRDLRRANEELDAAAPENKARAALLANIAAARERAASSSVFATSWRLYADQLEKDRLVLQRQRLENATVGSGLDTVFTSARVEAGQAMVTKLRAQIQPKLDAARQTSTTLSGQLRDLRESGSASDATISYATEAAGMAEKITRSYELWLAALQQQESTLQAVGLVVSDPESVENLAKSRDAATATLDELGPWKEFLRRNIQDTGRSMETHKTTPPPTDAAAKKFRAQAVDLTEARFAQLRELDDYLARLLPFEERVLNDAREHLVGKNIAARASHAASQFQMTASRIWNTEVFTADQTFYAPDGTPMTRKRGVTLGRLVLAVAIGFLALMFAKRFARLISKRLRQRFVIDATRGQFLDRAIFFAIAATIVLSALHWLHIPLTAFAFMGGALAIGIGFGVQTLMNNFISGLIVTAERRVRVGDLIEVDGHRGSVVSLGTRCSTILKPDGIEVLVPNSYLLEKNVANWTMSDPHHRFDFLVGVDYGSDTDKVMKVLGDAVTSEQGVSHAPAPSVFFEAFGANSLEFRVYYWIDIRTTNPLQIGSNLRLKINRLCAGAGIQIADPRRDVHLHAEEPLRVQISNS